VRKRIVRHLFEQRLIAEIAISERIVACWISEWADWYGWILVILYGEQIPVRFAWRFLQVTRGGFIMAVQVLGGKPSFSSDEYLARERRGEFKSEYQDGRIYAMAGGSPQHSAIAANVIGELRGQLKGKPCRAYTSDLKIGSATSRQFAYPDVSVVCGELKYHDVEKDVVTNPVLIAEVLSDTTEANDRGDKFFRYRQLETLTDYLLISQKRSYIEHYEKQADGRWLLATTAVGLEATVPVASLGCTLLLSEVYDKVEFDETGVGDAEE
jgi:Uma2 family endonuclease